MTTQPKLIQKACLALAVAALATSLILPTAANAQAIVNSAGYTANTLNRNDDGSTGLVNIGFTANFFGTNYSSLFVNNNGNVTFNAPLGAFTPFNLVTTATPIIAPFFADVDTRNLGSGVVQYGTDTFNGRAAFGVNWFSGGLGVGYFASRANLLNTFQLLIVDRSDTGIGNFDFIFNYGDILWETGDASGGSNGLGGFSARAGFSNGSTNSFELAGSAQNGAFLNGGPFALQTNSLNSNVAGRYIFEARNGTVGITPVPETGSTLILLTAACAGVTLLRRRFAR